LLNHLLQWLNVEKLSTGKEGNEMTKGKNAFSVRVRSATILDVKRCTSTLRSAINLLRIDFQAYAEGIFLPLARELQQVCGMSTMKTKYANANATMNHEYAKCT